MYNNALPQLKINAQNVNVCTLPVQWYESLIESSFHIAHDNSSFRRKAKITRDGYSISWLEAGPVRNKSILLDFTSVGVIYMEASNKRRNFFQSVVFICTILRQ